MDITRINEELIDLLGYVESNASFKEEPREEDLIKRYASIRGYLAKIEVRKNMLEGLKEETEQFQDFCDIFEEIAELAYKEAYSQDFENPLEDLKQIKAKARKARKKII